MDETPGIDGKVVGLIVAGMMALAVGGLGAFRLLAPAGDLPPAVAADPMLVRGREIYLERCVSCHGSAGRGDGPIARGLAGPPPRNLVGETWKHGDRPEQVLAVLRDGVKETAMPAWAGTYGPDDLRAVAAYVFHLSGRAQPEALRAR